MICHNLKICGITTRDTACFCAEAGVGALGAIFFAQSPRYVTPTQAHKLFEKLPKQITRVGVFVNTPSKTLIAIAHEAELDTLQLHGDETLETMLLAYHAGFRVIKVLKSTGQKLIDDACAIPNYIGIMVECGNGTLPGGNGAVWNWAEAAPLAALRPFALAGGLTPHNLPEAIRNSKAIAWDLSSGVEDAPGIKNHTAIIKTINALSQTINATHFWSAPIHKCSQKNQ